MSNLARSCLRLLVLYLLAAAAVGAVVYHRMPVTPVAIWSGLIAGFFVWLTVAYLFAIPAHVRDWWRMRQGVAPSDGKRVAIIGTIHSSGASLHAPFSKTACVAYEYKIVSLKGESPSNDYRGFAMVPSYVSTGSGQVRILAYPELDVEDEPLRGPEVKQNAREYIASTAFLAIRSAGVKGAAAELRNLLADDDGAMRYDHRMEPVADSLDDCRLTERVVRPGDTVCALGLYSEQKRALVPDPAAIMHAVTIRRGTPESFRRGMLRKAVGSAAGAIVCAALLAAAGLLFAVNVPLDAAEQMNPRRRFVWQELQFERWLEKNVRTPLVEAGTLSDPGLRLMTDLCSSCAAGRLEANGRLSALTHASAWETGTVRVLHLARAEGEADGVRVTFDRKAIGWRIEVIQNGRTFPVPDDWTLPGDVQVSWGSHEMTGRVTVMAPTGAVRLRAAFRTPIGQK